MSSYQPVRALLRGMEILTVVSRLQGKATVGEIHRETTIDKATIVRALETLMHAGFVVRSREGSTYEVTGKTLLLCAGYDRHRSVGRIVAPVMEKFRALIGWPSDIAIFDHDSMLIVETSRMAGPMMVNRRPGYRAPILATSLGLAYMAYCPAGERERIFANEALKPEIWNAPARDPRLGAQLVESIRCKGYATMHPEYSRREYAGKVMTLGVPVLREGLVLATLNALYLCNAHSEESAVSAIFPELQRTAVEIARLLKE